MHLPAAWTARPRRERRTPEHRSVMHYLGRRYVFPGAILGVMRALLGDLGTDAIPSHVSRLPPSLAHKGSESQAVLTLRIWP